MIKHDYLLKERSMKVRNFMPLILYTICLCFLLYSLLTKFYIAFTENVPREYREMNSIKFAVDFAANMNPYAGDLLDQDYPFATNMYGIAMPLFLSIFVRIFGCITNLSILQICQIVTVFIELFGVCMIYYIGYVKTHSHLLSVFSSLLLMACYWRYSAFAGAFPDSYGITLSIFLFLLVLYFLDFFLF